MLTKTALHHVFYVGAGLVSARSHQAHDPPRPKKRLLPFQSVPASSGKLYTGTPMLTSPLEPPMIALPPTTVITLDGLAASGKSSVARGVALALGVPYISSGLLYRLVALCALEMGTDIHNEVALLEMVAHNEFGFEPRASGNTAFLNGAEVTNACHSSRVDAVVSAVAQHLKVREWVNSRIRAIKPPFVAEGRDMGAVVFRDAPIKIFLTASSRVRAQRRVSERSQSLESVQAAIEARDASDLHNTPIAPDAFVLDSSELDLEQTIRAALELIESKVSVLS
jgi:CMP/dCMP kinase